jgi:hypothetical protein
MEDTSITSMFPFRVRCCLGIVQFSLTFALAPSLLASFIFYFYLIKKGKLVYVAEAIRINRLQTKSPVR